MDGASILAPVLLALLVLAGCSGPPAKGQAATAPASTSDPGLGSVGGLVVDDATLPIPGAAVGLLDVPSAATTTDAAGAFKIINVPPGSHTLAATKPGFTTQQVRVQVGEAEAVVGVQVQLAAVQKPAEPFTNVIPGKAFISCSFTTPAFGTTATQPCGWDPNNKPLVPFEVEVAKGLVAAVLEMSWTPTVNLHSDTLRVGLWKDPACSPARCDTDHAYGYANGKSPLKLQVGNASVPFRDDLEGAKPTKLAGAALVRDPAQAGQDPADVAVVLQQPVDVTISVFYNRDPPRGYTALT